MFTYCLIDKDKINSVKNPKKLNVNLDPPYYIQLVCRMNSW